MKEAQRSGWLSLVRNTNCASKKIDNPLKDMLLDARHLVHCSRLALVLLKNRTGHGLFQFCEKNSADNGNFKCSGRFGEQGDGWQ